VIELKGLTVRYGKAEAVSNVSFGVLKGSVIALLGRNGAGKSSLVRCLLGQQRPTSGAAHLFGADAWTTRTAAMSRIGVVPEDPDAPAAMTASQLSAFSAPIYPKWDAKGYSDRLARFGVPLTTPFGRLSKGQKGHVMLALALAPAPELLVLDDPTLGLDAVARREVFGELVEELADRGTTVLLTSHDLEGVERIADRVGILKEGRLVLDETLDTLKQRFRRIRYGNEETATRTEYGTELDSFDAVKVKVRGWGIEAVVTNYDDLSYEKFARKDGVVDPSVEPMSLEEIFLAVAGEAKGEGK
jgi:ABC-2 type transport system ATP-binding protein